MSCKHPSCSHDAVFALVHSCPIGKKQLPAPRSGASGTGHSRYGGFSGLNKPELQHPFFP